MAPKSPGRRCPNCGARTTDSQTYCPRCGTRLPIAAPSSPRTGGSGWLKKALFGLLILVAIIGIGNRFISNDHIGDVTRPPATRQAQIQPTRSPDSDRPSPTRSLQTQSTANDLPAGFLPASWTTQLPDGVELGTIASIRDGDTFDISVDGETIRYRLYRADTPETYNPRECGGNEATAFVRAALAQSDTPNQVWVEDVRQLDKHGRTLAYLWFTIDGQPYLLNHLLINSGWAENIGYGDAFDPYRTELAAAASYAYTYGLGVWGSCGDFGMPRAAALAIPTAPPAIQPTDTTPTHLATTAIRA